MLDLVKASKKRVLVGMGASGTNLATKGFSQTGSGALWIVDNADAYKELLKEWVNVGCDCIRMSPLSRLELKRHGMEHLKDKVPEVNRRVVQLSREVVPGTCFLGWNMRASAPMLPPVGSSSPEEVYESFLEEVAIARDNGVDYLEIPSSDIEQMRLAIKAAKENCKLPVAALLHAINPTPRGYRNIMGVDPASAARKFQEFGADFVGLACGGISYEQTTEVLKQMKAACNLPLWARPNAGVPELVNGKTVHPQGPEKMGVEAPKWVEAGARVIAGCCGSTPEHMARVVSVIKRTA